MIEIKCGETVKNGNTEISCKKNANSIMLTVGEYEIPMAFELEDSPWGGYGVANMREMVEMEAREEYVLDIFGKKFHDINYHGITGLKIKNYVEENGIICFELVLVGDYISMPGSWNTVIGTVKLPDKEIV